MLSSSGFSTVAWIRQRWSKQVGGTAPWCIGGQPNQTLPFFLLYKIFRLRLLPRLLMRLLTIVAFVDRCELSLPWMQSFGAIADASEKG